MNITKNDKNQIFCKCNHCGNIGYQDIRGTFQEMFYENVEGERVPSEQIQYYFLECPVCFHPIIVSGWYAVYSNMEDEDLKLEYPQDGFKMYYAPSPIQEQYLNTQECFRRNDYGLCLASLRILLEKIAVDKGAIGTSLEKKIEDLARKDIIPSTIKEASTIVRKFGNKGAHGSSALVTKAEIKSLFEFVEILISYIYEIPQSIKMLATKADQKIKW